MQEATKTAPEASKASGNTKPQAAPEFKPTLALDASSALVNKSIESIKNRGAKLDRDVHSTALACLWHVQEHGDITLMNRLLLALPKSTRRNALGKWAVQFGKLKLNEDKAAAKEVPLLFNREGKTDIAGATAMPFWELKNVAEGGAEWNFDSYMNGVIKVLTKQAESNPKAKELLATIQLGVPMKVAVTQPAMVQ